MVNKKENEKGLSYQKKKVIIFILNINRCRIVWQKVWCAVRYCYALQIHVQKNMGCSKSVYISKSVCSLLTIFKLWSSLNIQMYEVAKQFCNIVFPSLCISTWSFLLISFSKSFLPPLLAGREKTSRVGTKARKRKWRSQTF